MTLPEEIRSALFSKWPVARLATVSAREHPHAVPIVFCQHDGVIYSPLDGKRKSSDRLKRFDNLATNPNAALLLDAYQSDWQNLWWVRVDGKADQFVPDNPDAEVIARRLVEKYPQYRDPSLMFDTSIYLRFRPGKITAWAQSGSATTISLAIAGLADDGV